MFWTKLFGKCKKKDMHGDVLLGHGKYKIKIQCCKHPSKISISIKENCEPICNSEEANCVAVKILQDGFILTADIKTNMCFVEWSYE